MHSYKHAGQYRT